MCGIIGYTGKKKAVEILTDALTRLEYRGYDSAGIGTVDGGGIVHIYKDKGRVAEIINKYNPLDLPGHTGIGHVRWATHGGVTPENAHPHCDESGQVAVIHNGIIDNYQALKQRLSKKYRFLSQTDTEVIPHLIREQIDGGVSFENAFFAAINQLEGSFAIIALNAAESNKLYAARRDSPIVLGIDGDANYIGSDVFSFLPYTSKAVYIQDEECAILTPDNYKIFDFNHKRVYRKPVNINLKWEANGKNNFPHYMLKEISEEPESILNAIQQESKVINRMAAAIAKARQVVFVACGTSRFASLIGRYVFSEIGNTFSDVIIGSEFGYYAKSIDKHSVIIALSQSGETADVINGVRLAKANGATVFSIVNVEGSSLARMSDETLYLKCGPEISVAATKSFTAQLCILYLLAFALDGKLSLGKAKLKELAILIDHDLRTNMSEIPPIALALKNHKDFYYLARGINFAMAGEGALKAKEISYVHAEGMPAGELKHGTIALIEPGTPVIAICPHDYTYDDIVSNIEETKARGARVIGISDINSPLFDDWIKIPPVEKIFYPLATIIPLQLFAYHSAIVRGLDPDRPRNLAKSVTVK